MAVLAGYYHFSSSGQKFRNKWDDFDVEVSCLHHGQRDLVQVFSLMCIDECVRIFCLIAVINDTFPMTAGHSAGHLTPNEET